MISSNSRSSAPAGYRFPREVSAVAVRWYLRYGLSYRDVEELLAERGIEVDHVTVYRWAQTLTPEFIDAARPARHASGDRWFIEETYVKVAGRWTYLYRAVDQHGQVIDVLVSKRRDAAAARGFFARALRTRTSTRSRSPAIGHRSTRASSTSSCRPRGTCLSSTATTSSKPITAGSQHGYRQCAGSSQSTRCKRSQPGMPSCRTCAADTTAHRRPVPAGSTSRRVRQSRALHLTTSSPRRDAR